MLPDVCRRAQPDRREQTALLLWGLALLVVSLRSALFPHAHSVYPIFATAARDWLAGADLYAGHHDPYRYSPLIAVLFVPFGLLPDGLGGVLWRCLSALVLVAALGWWCRDVLPSARGRRGWLLLLVLPLTVGNLYNGQSNVLVLGLMLAAVAGLARGHKPQAPARGRFIPSLALRACRDERSRCALLAAACASLACLFKVYPIALCLLLVLAAPRRFGRRLLLVVVAGLALPFLCGRPDYVASQYLGWLHHLAESDRCGLPRDLWYRDFRLLCADCGLPLGAGTYLLVQVLAGAGMALVVVACRRAGWPRRRLLALLTALGCYWMTVFGSAAESATYVLVGPAAAWAVVEAWPRRRPAWLRLGALLGYSLLVAAQAAGWFPWGKAVHTLGIQPAAGLLLLACLLTDTLGELRAHRAGPARSFRPLSTAGTLSVTHVRLGLPDARWGLPSGAGETARPVPETTSPVTPHAGSD